MAQDIAHLDQPVTTVMRRDFVVLGQDFTIQEALDAVRQHELGERIIYFYVADDQGRLIGVVPTRRLLMANLPQRISDIMVRNVITIPHTATVLDACEFFVMHRLLAFPIVDRQEHMIGTVDVKMFAEEVFDITERERTDEAFELIGFRLSQIRDAAPAQVFRYRFPWLGATIGSGLFCAVLASAFETTLAKSIVLAFFLTLILGLGESVSSQSMTVTIQALRATRPRLRWYLKALRRELETALLLGAACGGIVAIVAALWRGEPATALVLGASILLSLCSACLIGLSVPTLLHALRLDPKIAAGPITLALADICTVLFYLLLAAAFL
ncbi:MAG: magnesium transporter [Planctomycetes bacterium]|nr:magnesium transporter [Planctomycetota bacterium]